MKMHTTPTLLQRRLSFLYYYGLSLTALIIWTVALISVFLPSLWGHQSSSAFDTAAGLVVGTVIAYLVWVIAAYNDWPRKKKGNMP